MTTARTGLRGVVVAGALLLVACSSTASSVPPSAPAPASGATPTAAPPTAPAPPGFLLPGQAGALPALPAGVPFTGHLLISESSSRSRILEIDPSGAVTWTLATTAPPLPHPLGAPDDAFYTIDGSAIVANSESGQGIMAVNRLSGAVVWQIGSYLRRGTDLLHFNNPDDAVPAADGTVWMADIRNCRLVHLDGATGAVIAVLGGHGCAHNPPRQFSEPNGAFPTPDGSLVVTEISGSRITWINADGSVRWSHHVPAGYPSDAMAYPDGSVLLTDYSTLGAVLRIAPAGTVIWRYAPRGGTQLNHPSIAIPLASNRIAICDDFNNRIVIVDPTNSTVVWQWTGSGTVHLVRPDGLDYRPS
jgi:outer membrane protein assembly factor BamB